MRVVRIPAAERGQQLEGAIGLLLIPEIDPVELVVGFAAKQPAFGVDRFHVAQAGHAVAPGQEQEEPEDLGEGRRQVGVGPGQPDAEAGVLECRVEFERPLEGFLDVLAVPSCRQVLASQDLPRDAEAVGATQIEPGLGARRLSAGPGVARLDGRVGLRLERLVQARVVGVQQDPPPGEGRLQHLAGLRRGAAAARCQRLTGLVEPCVQNLVVDAGEPVHSRQPRRPGPGRAREHAGNRNRGRAGSQSAPDHDRLVLSPCFSACRSMASWIRRSSRAG